MGCDGGLKEGPEKEFVEKEGKLARRIIAGKIEDPPGSILMDRKEAVGA